MDEKNPVPKRVPKLGPDIKAKIGTQLRAMYGEVVAQGVPERFKAILEGLTDEQDQAPVDREAKGGDPANIAGEPEIGGNPKI